MTYLHAVLSKQILTIDFQMYVVVAVRLTTQADARWVKRKILKKSYNQHERFLILLNVEPKSVAELTLEHN